MKKARAFLCFCLIFAVSASGALAAPVPPELSARAAILTDYSGHVIFEKNAREKLPPASVTKIMTMLLLMEAIEAGKVSFDDVVTFSEHAASMGGSQTWAEVGEQMTVHELLKCIAVVSANDCSVAAAELLAGSEESFVAMMNQRAEELSMEDTHFVNCCGLPAEGHVTSARDIALMSAELLKHEKITEYTTIWMDSVRNGQFGLSNTNKLLRRVQGITGLKTGSTEEARFCLSASAERDGMGLIAVVLSCPTGEERFNDAAMLLNYGFANYSNVPVTTDEAIPTVPVVMGEQPYVHGALAAAEPVLVEKGALSRIVRTLSMEKSVKAPVAAGQSVGKLSLYLDGELLAETPVTAAQAVPRLTVRTLFLRIMQGILMCKLR